jgi:prepilin-type N-terminal cleavage/methylation domain-containing protein
MSRFPTSARHGFTILEMAIVLFVIGLIGSLLVGASSSYLEANRRKAVQTQLEALDTAFASFVALNKRLPCPADGLTVSGAVGAGGFSAGTEVAAGGVCTLVNQLTGVVPWVTLGLKEADITDPWNNRISYRVDPALAASTIPLMNMSNCDPSSTGATGAGGICQAPAGACTGTAACTSPSNFLANKGLDVWDGQNTAVGFAARQNNRANGSGAAYVLISHGQNGLGAYRGNGLLNPGDVPHGLNEVPNENNQALALPAVQATVYRDAPLNDVNNTITPPLPAPQVPGPGNHFDDYLSHPTIMTVLAKANLGPRAH